MTDTGINGGGNCCKYVSLILSEGSDKTYLRQRSLVVEPGDL